MTLSTQTVKDCHFPWTWMMVSADGNVRPCCLAPGTLGNIHEASPEEVWNGELAQELRAAMVANQVHPVCAGAACQFVQNMAPTNLSPIEMELAIFKPLEGQFLLKMKRQDVIAAYKIFLGRLPQDEVEIEKLLGVSCDQALIHFLLLDEFISRPAIAPLIFSCAKKILDRSKVAEGLNP
jgi:hypothetical protein